MKNSRLTLASILFLSVLIAWPILTYYSLPAGNNYIEQLKSIQDSPGLFKLNFVVAFLIAPLLTFMLYEFYKKLTKNQWSPKMKLLFSLYILYFIFVSVSYVSQFLYFPHLINTRPFNETINWYFYNQDSLCYLINQTAYLIWAVTTILIFTPYLFTNTLVFFIIKILTLSALTQIISTIGLYTDNSNLSSLSFYSGLLLIPAAILIIIYSLKRNLS